MTIAYHKELRGSITADMPLAAYDPPTNRWGTQVWHDTFTLQPGSYLMKTDGHTMIKHRAIPHPDRYARHPVEKFLLWGVDGDCYAIYANTRIVLFSAANVASLPPVGTVPPESIVLAIHGNNIRDAQQHYALLPADSTRVLNVVASTGWAFRIEMWAASGSDGVLDVDNLGALSGYNAPNIHQFNIKVETL